MKLARNPIIDAIAEVRFTSAVPSDAIIGLVYEKVRSQFGAPEGLPILQLPAALREADPNLRYQHGHRFKMPGHSLLVGPRTIALSSYPYIDWPTAKGVFAQLLTQLTSAALFERVERIGLRYINLFEDKLNIFEHSTMRIEIEGESIFNQSITLRTERSLDDFLVVTQMSNHAIAEVQGQKKSGSALDIDVIKENPHVDSDDLPGSLIRLFDNANAVADKTFFGLLKQELIDTYEPEGKDESSI